MKNKFGINTATGRHGFFLAAALLTSLAVARADDPHYQQVNLISDQPGMAVLQDPNLVNAWGVSFGPATPFWVSDNGTGLSTLYSITNDSSGTAHVTKVPLEVAIPGDGTPTGQVFNNLGGFDSNLFLFVSEDGTISGWHGALGNKAETLVAGVSNNVYKGVALVSSSNGPVLLAANFRQATVDVYGSNSALMAQFSDSSAPAGYAPFNVQAVGDLVFVTFAKQDDLKHDDVAGPGNGLIDILDPQTGMFHRFATGTDAGGKVKEMNSPWGIALAPDSFGKEGGELLVGNFGSGTIMVFDARGRFRGELKGQHGQPVVIDGLWALTFGNGGAGGDPGTLYFSAGPDGESHGLFGSLAPVKDNGHDGNGHGFGGNGQGGHNQGDQGNRGGNHGMFH
ncbi:MAG TPA: TIGR03118 family protein [Candidatus Angelobacter sp.]|nr:TIGR03118 family protein [Candidatus Angelobacter sp.]